MSAHIPDTREKTTLFSGWYANRTRGYRRQHSLLAASPPVEAAPRADARAPLEARRSWARLIRLVYAVDPLLFPQCSGVLRAIAVSERPAVSRQILDPLGLSSVPPRVRAPPDPPGGQGVDQVRERFYDPCFENLPVPDVADPVVA